MYEYIIGKLVQYGAGKIVVENNSIGYQMLIPRLHNKAIGETIKVYTYLYVREDIFDLYGFITEEERNLFMLLISVNKVGPKLALQVLASMYPEQFALAILRSDIKSLTAIKGLGKKNAERLIIDLKDKLKKTQAQSDNQNIIEGEPANFADSSDYQQVVEALTVLGYDRKRALQQVNLTFDESLDLNANIKNALSSFDKRQ